jgi:hypothetical protein
MHDIKYFFSINVIKQSSEAKKFLGVGSRLPKVLSKNTDFENPKEGKGGSYPLIYITFAPCLNNLDFCCYACPYI